MKFILIIATCTAALSLGIGNLAEQAYPAQRKFQETSNIDSDRLKQVKLTPDDRNAIARVTYAEAADQGDAGIVGVVYTILNRLISDKYGQNITEVVNAPAQFEPVTQAGGRWTDLPDVTEIQQSKVDTIINLALVGVLPDITNGALFFQNPVIVAHREKKGVVSEGLTDFYGTTPSAVIRDHAFYRNIKNENSNKSAVVIEVHQKGTPPPKFWDIYENAKRKAAWNVYESEEQQ